MPPTPETFVATKSKTSSLRGIAGMTDSLNAAASEVLFATKVPVPLLESVVARRYRVKAEFTVTSSGSAVTITLRLKAGSVTIATIATIAVANSQTAVPMSAEFTVMVDEVGDTGDLYAWGRVISEALTNKTQGVTAVKTEVDNNAAYDIGISVESSAATGGCPTGAVDTPKMSAALRPATSSARMQATR